MTQQHGKQKATTKRRLRSDGVENLQAPSSPAPTEATPAPREPRRHRLPPERRALTHKFSVAGHEGYITVGLFDDGTPGELFVRMSKQGSTLSGLMDCFATAVSLALQYGVPLRVLVAKFAHTRFEPAGFTGNPELREASSVADYIFRWLALRFGDHDEELVASLVAEPPVE